jgi:hypothetical protein
MLDYGLSVYNFTPCYGAQVFRNVQVMRQEQQSTASNFQDLLGVLNTRSAGAGLEVTPPSPNNKVPHQQQVQQQRLLAEAKAYAASQSASLLHSHHSNSGHVDATVSTGTHQTSRDIRKAALAEAAAAEATHEANATKPDSRRTNKIPKGNTKQSAKEGLTIQAIPSGGGRAGRYDNITSALSTVASPMHGGYYDMPSDYGPRTEYEGSVDYPKQNDSKPRRVQSDGLGDRYPKVGNTGVDSPSAVGLSFRVRGSQDLTGSGTGWMLTDQQEEDEEAAILRDMKETKVSLFC